MAEVKPQPTKTKLVEETEYDGHKRSDRSAGVYSIGIPRDSIVTYETAIKAGQYLVVAHGTAAKAAKARNILSTLKPTQVTDHVLAPAAQAVTR